MPDLIRHPVCLVLDSGFRRNDGTAASRGEWTVSDSTILAKVRRENNRIRLPLRFPVLSDDKVVITPKACHRLISAFYYFRSWLKSTLNEWKGKGDGCSFSITDKAPAFKAGEYKSVTHCGIPVGNLLVMFTIFSNEKESVDVSSAREIVANATQK
jgi:hypothetical protein